MLLVVVWRIAKAGHNACPACEWLIRKQLRALTLLRCHLTENEKRLVKKCRELNTEIVSNAAKVQTALKLSEEDQQTIVALKKEIEKAWKMVDASHEKVTTGQSALQQIPSNTSQGCLTEAVGACHSCVMRSPCLLGVGWVGGRRDLATSSMRYL